MTLALIQGLALLHWPLLHHCKNKGMYILVVMLSRLDGLELIRVDAQGPSPGCRARQAGAEHPSERRRAPTCHGCPGARQLARRVRPAGEARGRAALPPDAGPPAYERSQTKKSIGRQPPPALTTGRATAAAPSPAAAPRTRRGLPPPGPANTTRTGSTSPF